MPKETATPTVFSTCLLVVGFSLYPIALVIKRSYSISPACRTPILLQGYPPRPSLSCLAYIVATFRTVQITFCHNLLSPLVSYSLTEFTIHSYHILTCFLADTTFLLVFCHPSLIDSIFAIPSNSDCPFYILVRYICHLCSVCTIAT